MRQAVLLQFTHIELQGVQMPSESKYPAGHSLIQLELYRERPLLQEVQVDMFTEQVWQVLIQSMHCILFKTVVLTGH